MKYYIAFALCGQEFMEFEIPVTAPVLDHMDVINIHPFGNTKICTAKLGSVLQCVEMLKRQSYFKSYFNYIPC